MKTNYFDAFLSSILAILILMMAYLFSGLFKAVNYEGLMVLLNNKDNMASIGISFGSILVSTGMVAVVGTVLAYKVQRKKGKVYRIINGLIMLPLLLPPTVAGLVLLQGLGKRSWLSMMVFGGDLSLAFNFIAIVITQVYVTLPFFYQMTLNAFLDVDEAYLEAGKVYGADSFTLLRWILVPLSKQAMVAGLMMSALRGLSEFGATIMFAGNMAGRTQTMTTRIYQLYQSDMGAALTLAAFQLGLFLIPYFMWAMRKTHGKELT